VAIGGNGRDFRGRDLTSGSAQLEDPRWSVCTTYFLARVFPITGKEGKENSGEGKRKIAREELGLFLNVATRVASRGVL